MMENKNINDHIVCEVEALKKELKSNLEVLLSNNMLMEARAAIAKYEEIDKLDAEMYSLKAIIEIHENNLETAIMILLEGYTLDRNNFDLLYNLGFVYILLKNNEKARFYLLKALSSIDNRESQELVQALLIKTDENQRFSELYKSQEVLKKKYLLFVREV
jgi:Flp pilus assembly protein TadD